MAHHTPEEAESHSMGGAVRSGAISLVRSKPLSFGTIGVSAGPPGTVRRAKNCLSRVGCRSESATFRYRLTHPGSCHPPFIHPQFAN
jgi:hypothetical protein